MESLLSVGEVAEIFKVSKRSIFRYRDAGEIPPGIKIGGTIRWRREDIENFINRRASKVQNVCV